MRIAVISNTAWYLFNFRLNLMLALQTAGHTVVAVAPVDQYADRISSAGVKFINVPISGGGTNPLVELKSVLAIRRLLKVERMDLVFSYTPKGNLYSSLACIALKTPFVPNVSGLGRAFIRRSVITFIAQTMYRLTFRRAHRVFFQNLDDMSVFINGGLVSAALAERLPGSGVDLNRFAPTAMVVRPPDAPVFLLVARMLWDKGVGEYIEAARQVRARYPLARFQLLGFLDVANPSAISRAQMDAWVAEGVVEYFPPTDDVRPFITCADCVVLPSYREGVPRSLLEAAAMARPVITTDAPGCRDTVVDGKTGYLCSLADANDLAEKMLRIIALAPGERAEMGLQGRALVARVFDETRVLARYLTVVDALNQAKSNRP